MYSNISIDVKCHRCTNDYVNGPVKLGLADSSNWTRRTMDMHVKNAIKWREATKQTEKDDIVSETGTRWSPLLELPYLNVIESATNDPMHGCFEVSINTGLKYINKIYSCAYQHSSFTFGNVWLNSLFFDGLNVRVLPSE